MCGISEPHTPQRICCDSDMFRGMRGFRGTLRPRVRARPPPAHVRDPGGSTHHVRGVGKYPEIPRKALESRAIPEGYVAGYRLHIPRGYPVIYLICQGFYPAAPHVQATRYAPARLRPCQSTHGCWRATVRPWCGMDGSLWHHGHRSTARAVDPAWIACMVGNPLGPHQNTCLRYPNWQVTEIFLSRFQVSETSTPC
jgi:hypothetical protein